MEFFKKRTTYILILGVLFILFIFWQLKIGEQYTMSKYNRYSNYYRNHKFIFKGIVQSKKYESKDFGEIYISKFNIVGNFAFDSLSFVPSEQYDLIFHGTNFHSYDTGDTVIFDSYIKKIFIIKSNNDTLEHEMPWTVI